MQGSLVVGSLRRLLAQPRASNVPTCTPLNVGEFGAARHQAHGSPSAHAAAGLLQAPAAQPLTAPSAAPAVAFASGAAVPMPAPFSVDASAPRPAAAPPPAPAAVPEPPAFGDYNPDDWLPPPDWQSPAPAPGPAAGTTTAWARVATAAPAKAPPAGGQPAARKAQPAAGGAPMAPEWERDERCRIYIQNLKPGLSADDLRTSFSK